MRKMRKSIMEDRFVEFQNKFLANYSH